MSKATTSKPTPDSHSASSPKPQPTTKALPRTEGCVATHSTILGCGSILAHGISSESLLAPPYSSSNHRNGSPSASAASESFSRRSRTSASFSSIPFTSHVINYRPTKFRALEQCSPIHKPLEIVSHGSCADGPFHSLDNQVRRLYPTHVS